MTSQRWDADDYARNARFVSELGAPVVDLLEPQPGERVLDLGCGDGELTRCLVAAGCRVVAVDTSESQVAAARARGLDARLLDAERLPFESEFDAVFSNAVLHWLRDHDALLAGVARALVPGGRMVAEFGGEGCVAAIRAALGESLARRGHDADALDPWYFPSAEEYSSRLLEHGFEIAHMHLFPRPTPLPSDVAGWIETFAQPFLEPVEADERAALLSEVCERLRPKLWHAERGWSADYVRLRFAARAP